jgi:hypothetical protein
MGFVVPLAYDLGEDDGSKPSAGKLAGNVAIQIAIEMAVDLVVICYLTSIVKQPLMAITHINFNGWTVWLRCSQTQCTHSRCMARALFSTSVPLHCVRYRCG